MPKAAGQVVTVHCLSTFASWPPPTVAISSGVATMDSGQSRETATTSASTGHSNTANSRAWPNSRHVACSLMRVVSQAQRPWARGARCGSAAGSASISRIRWRSTQATGIPARAARTSSGIPTSTTVRTAPAAAVAAISTSATAPVTAPVSRYPAERHGHDDSRKPGPDMACHTFRGCMEVTVEGPGPPVPSGQGALRGYAWPYLRSRPCRTAAPCPRAVS